MKVNWKESTWPLLIKYLMVQVQEELKEEVNKNNLFA